MPDLDPTKVTDPPKTDDTNDPETDFWKKFDERIDAGVKRNLESYQKSRSPGSSRTGRATLPGILADFVFGPATKD